MRHAETESYIVGNGRVESAFSNIGVEFQETDTGRSGITTASFYAVLQDETEFLQALLVDIVLLLEVLHGMLLRLLDESADDDISTGILLEMSKSNLFKLSVRSREKLLKHGYFSECLATALANILKKNPP